MRVKRLLTLVILVMIGSAAYGRLYPLAAVMQPAQGASERGEGRVLLMYNSPEPSDEVKVMEGLLQHFAVKTESSHSANIGDLYLEDYDSIIFFDSGRNFGSDPEGMNRMIRHLNIPYMVFHSGTVDVSFTGITLEYRDEVYSTMPIRVAPVEPHEDGVVLAAVSDGREERPLIVRNGDGWNVYGKLESGLVSWIIADVLHDFLGEHHAERHKGLYIVHHVNPLTPPEQLRKLADLLGGRSIPFAIVVEPVGRSPDRDRLYAAGDDPEWGEAIRYMVEAGGTVVLDGSELDSLEPKELANRIDQGIALLYEIGVYPIALYASQDTVHRLQTAPEHADFTTTLEYSSTRTDGSRSADIPYASAAADDAIMYPASIGIAVSDAAASQMITRASALLLVRDAWLGIGLDAAQPYELAEYVVEHFREEPILWTDIRYDAHKVDAGFIRVETGGDGLLEVQMLDKARALELVRIDRNSNVFGTVTYYSTWILVAVVGTFVVLFTLFVVLMRLRRRRRLFSEKELE